MVKVSVFFKSRNHCRNEDGKEISDCRQGFSRVLQGSIHLGEMKTSYQCWKVMAIKAHSKFSEMVNAHFKQMCYKFVHVWPSRLAQEVRFLCVSDSGLFLK